VLHIVRGKGVFLTGSGKRAAGTGSFVVTEPEEPHGFRAEEKSVLLAVIAPRP
jgi:quercetin dioxygenase-like cupin family protein